jgi:type IV pilus assembly protein PilC
MTAAGEKTGRLSETLEAMSAHYDRKVRIAASVRNAVLYPAVLLVMMTAVVLILIVRVLPIFNEVFGRLGSQMSPLAVKLMRFGEWLFSTPSVIIVTAVIALTVLLLVLVLKIPGVKFCVNTRLIIPIKHTLGGYGILGDISSSRFICAMALAITSGLDIQEAVKMSASVSGGAKSVDKKHIKCSEMLCSGSTLSEAMLQSGILSVRDSRILSVGCRSGMTDKAMAEIAGRSERDVQETISRMVGMIEPALVIIASVVVGIILLSVMLPLVNIMNSIT